MSDACYVLFFELPYLILLSGTADGSNISLQGYSGQVDMARRNHYSFVPTSQ